MDGWSSFFNDNIVLVFFVHGLALCMMGALITLEAHRSRPSMISRNLAPLGYFGLLASIPVWLEMFAAIPRSAQGPDVGELLHQLQPWNCLQCHMGPGQQEYVQPSVGSHVWDAVSLAIFIAALLCLLWFGLQLLHIGRPNRGKIAYLPLLLVAIWALASFRASVGGTSWAGWLGQTHVYSRYILYVPGALLAAAGLWRLHGVLVGMGLPRVGVLARIAAMTLVLDAVFDGVIVAPATFAPASMINHALFFQVIGVPVQLFRAVLASGVAYLIVQVIREADREQGLRINRMLAERIRAQEDAMELEARRREIVEHEKQLRGEVLRQVIAAQEEERKRVARELHDEMGQTLTGLATGLEACIGALGQNRELARVQLEQLRVFAERAVDDVHRLIADLRPALLDDLGLLAALRWYGNVAAEQAGFSVKVVPKNWPPRLPPHLETVLFRIAQEALTNVIRHAGAKEVTITLECGEAVSLEVADDGRGFDSQSVLQGSFSLHTLGLLGMRERALLAGGTLEIISRPGEGCRVVVSLPYEREGAEVGGAT